MSFRGDKRGPIITESGVVRDSYNQKGDPAKAAAAMQAITEVPKPPFRLPLGEAAYRVVPAKLQAHAEELAQWEYLGKPTDFDAL